MPCAERPAESHQKRERQRGHRDSRGQVLEQLRINLQAACAGVVARCRCSPFMFERAGRAGSLFQFRDRKRQQEKHTNEKANKYKN